MFCAPVEFGATHANQHQVYYTSDNLVFRIRAESDLFLHRCTFIPPFVHQQNNDRQKEQGGRGVQNQL